jgi:hypothetical protein
VLAAKENTGTGVIEGNVGKGLQLFGVGKDAFTTLGAEIQYVHNVMLSARSGKAVTDGEYKRFINEFPKVTDDDKDFKIKADLAWKHLKESMEQRAKVAAKSGTSSSFDKSNPPIGANQIKVGGITLSVED